MYVHDQDSKDVLSVFEFFKSVRWPDGVICPRCKSVRTKKVANQKRHNCNDCRRQFSVRTETVFEKSRSPLRKWLYALYMLQAARKCISSVQLSKELGITQKAAWFMLDRIREAMDPGPELLSGEVEVDESYVGGQGKDKHANKKLHKRWIEGKQIVLGMRERDGRIVLRPVHSGEKVVITDEVLFTIEKGSTQRSLPRTRRPARTVFNLRRRQQSAPPVHPSLTSSFKAPSFTLPLLSRRIKWRTPHQKQQNIS